MRQKIVNNHGETFLELNIEALLTSSEKRGTVFAEKRAMSSNNECKVTQCNL